LGEGGVVTLGEGGVVTLEGGKCSDFGGREV